MNFEAQLDHDDAAKIACIECGAQIGEYCVQPKEADSTPDDGYSPPQTHRIRFSSLTSALIIEEYLTHAHSVTRT